MHLRGRNLESGLPQEISVDAGEIAFAIRKTVRDILRVARTAIAEAPPELAGDLLTRGITLVGSGALLPGIDRLMQAELCLPVWIAENPGDCTVCGMIEMLERPSSFVRLSAAV